jgi:23S rRNA pseudouridine2605 synthase
LDLEDGRTRFDAAEYVNGNPREIGVELHSGKNRIVRRMFEALGHTVVKLDRVQFASLTKKDLPRGYFRHLTEKEIAFLKMSK